MKPKPGIDPERAMKSEPGIDPEPDSTKPRERGLALWTRALRAPFLTASGLPVVLGAFAAYSATGQWSLLRFVLTLVGVLCVHLGANLANDYFDEVTGCDRANPDPTPFSGGSRVIQEGLIPSRTILAVSILFLAAGLVQGLILNSMIPGNMVLFLGLAGIAVAVLYTAVPIKLSYRGVGEFAVFAAFGPLEVAGSYLCQAGRVDSHVIAVSIPAGLLVLAILLVNEVLDVDGDRRVGKRTMVVAMGKKKGYGFFLLVYAAAYAWIILGMAVRVYPLWAALALIPAVVFSRDLLPARALKGRPETIRASRNTILSQVLTTLLLALAFLF
jgi:1,4-dihydroxy-2-naphthoate octaprenyltransferase